MVKERYTTFVQAKALKELGVPQWNGETMSPYYNGYDVEGNETSVYSSNKKNGIF